jgi:hypothetical protein
MILSELFDIKNGLASSQVHISEAKDEIFTVPYIRPSSSYSNLIAWFIDPHNVQEKCIFPKETIFVSTDGDGSHSYSYVAPMEFIPNSNVAVLIPKRTMSLKEKVYYADCITRNRYKFSYGRKPKWERLAIINLPEKMPERFEKINFIDETRFATAKSNNKYSLDEREWNWFLYADLFDIKTKWAINSGESEAFSGDTPFVCASVQSNGISGYTGFEPTHPGNVITVAKDGNGTSYAFYQDKPFCINTHVLVFYPKFELNQRVWLFLCTLITKENYRYWFGRAFWQERAKQSKIKLPINLAGEPDWQWIEKYVNGLPYSASLV